MNEHSSRSHAIFIVTVECCAVSYLHEKGYLFHCTIMCLFRQGLMGLSTSEWES